jgi:hypothetical protein
MARFYIENNTLRRRNVDSKGLDGSIEKWQFIVDYYKDAKVAISDGGTRTCYLCLEHFGSHKCPDCPIAEHTGASSCIDTPYEGYHDAYFENELEDCKKYAQEELEFLLALRHSVGEVSGQNGGQNG